MNAKKQTFLTGWAGKKELQIRICSNDLFCALYYKLIINYTDGWQPQAQLGDGLLPVMQSATFNYNWY